MSSRQNQCELDLREISKREFANYYVPANGAGTSSQLLIMDRVSESMVYPVAGEMSTQDHHYHYAEERMSGGSKIMENVLSNVENVRILVVNSLIIKK